MENTRWPEPGPLTPILPFMLCILHLTTALVAHTGGHTLSINLIQSLFWVAAEVHPEKQEQEARSLGKSRDVGWGRGMNEMGQGDKTRFF